MKFRTIKLGWKKHRALVAGEQEMWSKRFPPIVRPKPVGRSSPDLLLQNPIDMRG